MTCARKRASQGPKSMPFESNEMSAPVSVWPPCGLLKFVFWRYFDRFRSESANPAAPVGRGGGWRMSGRIVWFGGGCGVGSPAFALSAGEATIFSDVLPTEAGAGFAGCGTCVIVALRLSMSEGAGVWTGTAGRLIAG